MTRQTHHTYRHSPHAKSPRPSTALKIFPRSLIISKAQLANRNRLQSTHTTSTNRYLKSRTRLNVINEEDEEDLRQTRDLYHEIDTYRDGSEYCQLPEREDEQMDWDDDTTFISMLQDTADESDQLEELADKFNAVMKAQGSELKNHFRTTIVPTSQRLKETHAILEVQVDPVFAAGLLAFDEMGKKMETALLHEADDAEKVLSKAQKNIQELLGGIEQAEADRTKLWTDFEQAISDHTGRLTNLANSMPDRIEGEITALEQKSKNVSKGNDDSVADQMKMLFLQKRR